MERTTHVHVLIVPDADNVRRVELITFDTAVLTVAFDEHQKAGHNPTYQKIELGQRQYTRPIEEEESPNVVLERSRSEWSSKLWDYHRTRRTPNNNGLHELFFWSGHRRFKLNALGQWYEQVFDGGTRTWIRVNAPMEYVNVSPRSEND